MHALASLDRRDFLKVVLKSTGALLAIQWIPVRAQTPGNSWCHLALMSDIHIKTQDDHLAAPYPKAFYYNPHGNLNQSICQILTARPEGLFITGDVAFRKGGVPNYQVVEQFLAPLKTVCPIVYGMGNHDQRDEFQEVIPSAQKSPVPQKYVLVIEQGPVRFIMLDSLMLTDVTAGFLGPEQLEWLRGFLAGSDEKPTILCLHHVPDEAGKSFYDSPQLFEIIRPVAKVKAVIYGHSHFYHCREWKGIHLINLPATGYSFKSEHPVGWVDARFSAQGAELTLKVVDGPREEDGTLRQLQWRA